MLYRPIRSIMCTPKIATCLSCHRDTSRYIATYHVLSSHWLATSGENRRLNQVSDRNCFQTVQVFYKFILTKVADSIFSRLHLRGKEKGYLVTCVPQGVKKYKSSSCYVCLSSTFQTFNDTLIILISSYGLSSFGFVFTLLMACATSIPLVTRPNTVCLLSNHGCHEKAKAD